MGTGSNVLVGVKVGSEQDRITFDGAYLYGRQTDPDTDERTTSEDRWFIELKYDYYLTKPLYVYGQGRVEQDRIADLDLRLIIGAGVGYQWIETADFTFRTEGGLAWLYEDFDIGDNSEEIVFRFAYYLTKQLLTNIGVFHDLQIYPAVDDFSDVFLTTQAGLRTSLTATMFGEVKVVVDYDSTPAPGAEDTDLRFLVSVGMTF